MGWIERCFDALDAEGMFENAGHRTRFKELMDCYGKYPFFSKGLCKCMYLSAWDDEHFAIMVEMLSGMTLGQERDTEEMRIEGEMRAEDHALDHADGEAFIYQLSSSFLAGIPFAAEGIEKLPEHYQNLVRKGLEAERVIEGI